MQDQIRQYVEINRQFYQEPHLTKARLPGILPGMVFFLLLRA